MHVGPCAPTTAWDAGYELPWWRDHARYRVGALTARAWRVRLCNMLTEQEHVLEVQLPAVLPVWHMMAVKHMR